METLKINVFDVLSRFISISEFENRLYANAYVKEEVAANDFINQLVSLNYNDKHILHEIEKLCFSIFNLEEYLVRLIENNCLRICASETEADALDGVGEIASQYKGELGNYELMVNFVYLYEDRMFILYDLEKSDFLWLLNIKIYAGKILFKFRDATLVQKIELLRKGIEFHDYFVYNQ